MTTVPATRRVLAVRHAPTVSAGLCVGDSEVPCTMTAQAVAEAIRPTVAGDGFACAWTSPLERCRGPAALLAESLQIPLRVDERLREISLGRWQLRPWMSIEAAEPARYRSWLESWLCEAPPDGELPSTLLERVRQWWRELPAGAHLLIAHAGVVRALRVLIDGKSWPQAMAMPVPHLQAECFGPSAA
jgi:alpha-ribazole phosphatase